jgi:hypothetical protein
MHAVLGSKHLLGKVFSEEGGDERMGELYYIYFGTATSEAAKWLNVLKKHAQRWVLAAAVLTCSYHTVKLSPQQAVESHRVARC